MQTKTKRPPYVPNGTGKAHALLANLIRCPYEDCEKYHQALLAEVRRLREAAVGR